MSLMKFPDELLTEIAEHFVIGLLDTPEVLATVGEHDCVSDARASLVALTLTNRRFNAIATRFLYHTVRIHDLGTLFYVVSRLLEAPHLAELVREIAVTADLSLSEAYYNLWDNAGFEKLIRSLDNDNATAASRTAYTAYRQLVKPFPDLERLISTTVAGEDEDLNGLGEAACALLLLLTSKARTLYLILPDQNTGPGEYPLLTSIFDTGPTPHVLSRLEHLLLASNPAVDVTHLPETAPRDFMLGRRVKHVELFGASLMEPENSVWADVWAHVETLKMKGADTSGAWWYWLCKEARPPLKEVEISTSVYFGDAVWDSNAPGLNEALSFCTGTLQRLRLDFGESRPSDEPYLGPRRKLACLPSMKFLTHLHIPPRLLFFSMDDMNRSNICDKLPPCLQILVLQQTASICHEPNPYESVTDIEEWSWDGPKYGALVHRAVLQLAFESADCLPRLEKVSVVRSSNGCGGWTAVPELDSIVTWTSARGLKIMSFSPTR
ncbi:hypothetical protein VTJ49DRAFT_7296 [Mycothermus thermophilus]|uniref:F-box domain-containing protein n=1 Tax=Humicola insolens TaxID=85995 RepID=A0ABR3VHS8_HUMIN